MRSLVILAPQELARFDSIAVTIEKETKSRRPEHQLPEACPRAFRFPSLG